MPCGGPSTPPACRKRQRLVSQHAPKPMESRPQGARSDQKIPSTNGETASHFFRSHVAARTETHVTGEPCRRCCPRHRFLLLHVLGVCTARAVTRTEVDSDLGRADRVAIRRSLLAGAADVSRGTAVPARAKRGQTPKVTDAPIWREQGEARSDQASLDRRRIAPARGCRPTHCRRHSGVHCKPSFPLFFAKNCAQANGRTLHR
jgi:hypothetical protein